MAPAAHRGGVIRRSAEPYNAETPAARLVKSRLTPTALFFVRSHGTAPRLDLRRHRVAFGGLVSRQLSLTARELEESFPRHELEVTVVCAGNRRSELGGVRKVVGEIPWALGAIGTARFGGVRLKDVLEEARPLRGARHAVVEGADEVAEGRGKGSFGGSIPLRKALAKETMIAFTMNGRPLTRDHGAPARLVVPGYIGARSVKWLAHVDLARAASRNQFYARAYRRLPAGSQATASACARARPLQEVEVNCAILSPEAGERLPAGRCRVRGFAMAGAGARVARVEVSGDGGRQWKQAKLAAPPRPWAWSLWNADIDVRGTTRSIAARAFDSARSGQPASLSAVWNLKGYVNNAVHRVPVRVGP